MAKTKSAIASTPIYDQTVENLVENIQHHIQSTLGKDPAMPDKHAGFMGLSYSIRDLLIEKWLVSQRAIYDSLAKRVYYLSMEFLPGRFLSNYLTNMELTETAAKAVTQMGFDLEELEEEEWDAGFGNGGLGRLASCYLDSVASLNIPCYGYGIRYDYGIFFQNIVNGYQQEQCDNWSRRGSPWEIHRQNELVNIQFYGHTRTYTTDDGHTRYQWVGGETVMAMACDILIPGYRTPHVTNMRLWSAKSSREFNLSHFNHGDYIGAVEAKVRSENISKVLYPSDEAWEGKELRLKQQYFFVAATLYDIFRRHKKQHLPISELTDYVAIQLNDTHPTIAIPEMMRLLMDEHHFSWDNAWDICQGVFGYTNHTVLPEALETWPVDLMAKVLPRHLDIIYEINHRFLESIQLEHPEFVHQLSDLSIISEGFPKQVRMAHLAIIGSHSVNGVARLHSDILKNRLFKDFNGLFPKKMLNITNGITPRRWLLQCNPGLSRLITETIGPAWLTDLTELSHLAPFADDPGFCQKWMKIKLDNKKRLSRYVLRKLGMGVTPDSLFDVHVKRIHEYKRQLLNILHVITLYHRIKTAAAVPMVPRTVFFAGKAAPAYVQAKLIIKLITSMADIINNDPGLKGLLKVVFLPNYCISQAEKIIPAADLSQQISTAGMEASGTGNMKLALNGALTVGTLDGANIEIMEEVGDENIFIFGKSAEEIVQSRQNGYDPHTICRTDPELEHILELIGSGFFSPEKPSLFAPVMRSLLDQGDYYQVLADYRSYVQTQENITDCYQNRPAWVKKAVLNTAHMGKFSSDRSIREYTRQIWQVAPLDL